MTNGKRVPKEVLVDFEQKMSLTNAADYFQMIATRLKEDGQFSLTFNGQEVVIKPSSTVEFEIKVEKENGKQKFEVELEWVEGQQDDTLTIQ